MSMSKADYIASAKLIRKNKAEARQAKCAVCYETVQAIAEDLATYFAADNPRFDRETFLAACNDEV